MKKLKSSFLAAAISLVCLGGAQAAVVVNDPTFTAGNLYNTAGIAEFSIPSAGMAGMQVTMCFAGTGCESATWGAGAIGASGGNYEGGNGWLFEAGSTDTFSDPFRVSVEGRLLQSFTLYGLGSKTVFDVLLEQTQVNPLSASSLSAPGSGNGRPFTLVELDPDNTVAEIDVTYFDKVFVDGQDFNDLFLGLRVDLTMAPGAAQGFSGLLRFQSDTDSVATGASLTPFTPPTPVPLPGTLALAGLGLAVLGASSRRRRA